MLHQPDLNRPLPRDLWLKRLTYRSWHRGCKETDLVLGTYCTRNIEQLPEQVPKRSRKRRQADIIFLGR